MIKWLIYCHTHTKSGRRYIGLTSQTMEKRWKNHICAARSSKGGRWHFPNAIRKYGPEEFDHMILQKCETLEQANRAEEFAIWFLCTRDPDFGFNLAKGGKHTPHTENRNPWDDQIYREKVTLANKITHNSLKQKILASRAVKKSNLRPEVQKNRREASFKRWRNPEYSMKISISCKNGANTLESKLKRSIIFKNKWKDHAYAKMMTSRSMAALSNPESRAKLSAASKAMWKDKECVAKKIESFKKQAAKKRDNRTHFDCKKHGPILLNECYSKVDKRRNLVTYSCITCDREKALARWRNKRR